MERLQKLLSTAGVASRRTAEELIRQGRVSVNGQTVTELGTRADAAADEIRVDGRRIKVAQPARYLLLNKPRGYVTTRVDPQKRKTVMQLLAGVREYVYPVGRLDYDSEGLLLVTNDGDLAAALTHPRHEVEREYRAIVTGVPDERALDRLARGVVLDGRRTAPASVRLVPSGRDKGAGSAVLMLTIREGRNRQVRRMCEAVGHPVQRLARTRIGPIRDDRLRAGQFRDLSADEVRALKRAVSEDVPRARAQSRPRHARPPRSALIAVLALVASGPAFAQDTREAAIAAQQAAKAADLSPPPPSTAERVTGWIQEHLLTERESSVFPYFDSVHGGGGFTAGAGYRRTFADRSLWSVRGLYSIRNYKLIQFDALNPDLAAGRGTIGLTAGWRDATEVGYYGLGMETSEDDRADFRFQQGFAGVSGTWRVATIVHARAAATFEDFTIKERKGDRPDVTEVHTPATAPGLGASPSFLHTDVGIGLDTRTSPGYSRVGSYVGAALATYIDTDRVYSFNRIDLDAVQHLPILRETWVLSLRGRLQTVVDDDDQVPYFLMPFLGSSRTLRGYSSARFRDRHSLVVSAEWRWTPNRTGLDMALFYDAGKVAARRADLNFSDLKHDVGIGLRLHGPAATLLRLELARGSEGWKTVFSSGAAF